MRLNKDIDRIENLTKQTVNESKGYKNKKEKNLKDTHYENEK